MLAFHSKWAIRVREDVVGGLGFFLATVKGVRLQYRGGVVVIRAEWVVLQRNCANMYNYSCSLLSKLKALTKCAYCKVSLLQKQTIITCVTDSPLYMHMVHKR